MALPGEIQLYKTAKYFIRDMHSTLKKVMQGLVQIESCAALFHIRT